MISLWIGRCNIKHGSLFYLKSSFQCSDCLCEIEMMRPVSVLVLIASAMQYTAWPSLRRRPWESLPNKAGS